MTKQEKVGFYIELWKQTVDVQKHFNDIELRIRGLALTVLTFVLGGASLAIRDNATVIMFGGHFQLGSLILFLGIVLWLTFYFVDQVWYHRLLIGAVVHGEALEDEIKRALPAAGLTKAITKNSPYTIRVRFFRKTLWSAEIHSTMKIRIFYFTVAAILVVSGILLQLALPTPRH